VRAQRKRDSRAAAAEALRHDLVAQGPDFLLVFIVVFPSGVQRSTPAALAGRHPASGRALDQRSDELLPSRSQRGVHVGPL
jgi:hypothetical protein